MNIEMKKEYLRRIFETGLQNKDYSTAVLYATFPLDEVKDILYELKDEFHLDVLIIIDFDYEKVKEFYDKKPTKEEIDKFIPRFPKVVGNMKYIPFDNVTGFSKDFYSDCSCKYFDDLYERNPDLSDSLDKIIDDDTTVVCCPNKEWAKYLLGNEDKLDELWVMIYKTMLNRADVNKEKIERVRIKDELNRLRIRNLHFYTSLGTDFTIALNAHSIWCSSPGKIESNSNLFNFPSYEVFTSPNCYSADGKIVLSRKESFYHDILIEKATFDFEKGRLINCQSNNEKFDSIVLYKKNKLNRIGEIALVSKESPLAKSKEFYGTLILDENAGCHFALGDYISECVDIDKDKLEEKGGRYYRYNTSKYHCDFVFGDDSVSVEATTRNRQKVLVMENGIWKI